MDISDVFCVDAQWCQHCKSLESEFNQVASSLQRTNIRLAKVDGSVDTALVERFQVYKGLGRIFSCNAYAYLAML